MTCTMGIGVYATYMLIKVPFRINSADDAFGVLILMLCPSILLANSSINIYTLERFYPDRLPGKKLYRFSIVLFILSLLVTITVAAVTVAGFYELTSQRGFELRQNLMANLLLCALAVISLTGCHILWNRVSLRKSNPT